MKTFRQLLEDIQVGPAPEEISYKGYTTKNLHHVPDAAKAFQATITRVQKGTLQDNGEVLAALKATDTYMKLNDMHLEQEKDLDSQELDQWLAAHEEAKSALTKIGEFEHHYDYWNSHNAELQYLKANQNMPQEAESVQIEEGPYSSGQLKASPEQLKQVNKVPSGGRTTTIVDRDAKGVYTLTMKDGKEVSKVYKESTEIGEASKLQGTPVVSLSDFGSKDTTKNKYGQIVPKKLKPNDPRVKMYTEPKKEGVSEAQSTKTGIYQTDVLGAKAYHAKCMEPNCKWESKRFDRIKQAHAAAEKHAKDHFKQGVAEGLADDFLAMAKNRNPNARIVTAVQKRKEAEETMKNREASGTKPAQAAPTSNPRPLGGHDPKSGRSYSESVEPIDEISAELKQKYLAAATKKHLQQFLGREKVRDKQELDKRRAAIQKTSKELTGKTHYQEEVEGVEEGWKQNLAVAGAIAGAYGGITALHNATPHASVNGVGHHYATFSPPSHAIKTVDDKGNRVYTWKTQTKRGTMNLYRPADKVDQIKEQGVAEGSLEEVDTRTLVNYVPKAGRTLASLPPEERKRRSGMMTRAYQKLIPRSDFSDEIKKYHDEKNKKQGVAEEAGIDEALDFKKEAAKHMKDMHDKNATPANKAYAQKMLQRALEASKMKDKVAATKHYMGEEVELEELRNVTQDQLGGRMGSSGPGFNKTPAGKEREVKRKQEHLKGQMQFTKSQGGIAGPKGKLPEEVELEEKTLTPAELKKREEVAKAMERKNPNMDMSRKMAIATAVAKRVAEQYDDAE